MKVIFLLMLLMPAVAWAQAGKEEIVFGMTPVVGVESTRLRFTPLAEHLSKRIGRPVKLMVARSYGELIERLARGEVELAKLSPLAYVRARRRIPFLKLLASHVAFGTATYSSYLVALQDSRFQTLDNLREARICFADPDSTSGYLYPLAYIKKDKKLALRELTIVLSGSHRDCLKDLLANRCDLAASWAGALRDARQAGLDLGSITIVAKTGRIPYDAYCVHPDLDRSLAEKIKKVLLDTNTLTKQGRQILAPTLGINGWVPGRDQTYDEVRRIEALLTE